MFKNDYGNKINEKDKKNNLDTDDLENLYQLLIKKNKDDNEKKICNIEYKTIWENIGDILFKKEGANKSENAESSKIKVDNTKNKFLENENSNLDIKDNMSFEAIFKIIRYQETSNFINSYDNEYDNYLNEEEEEPPVIKAFINEIQNLEKIVNSDKKSEKLISKKKIQLYLFLIYLILKNYPFYVPKRSYLEKYYLQLKKYKDWPEQIGVQGKKLYSLFINELYLPGITIFKEIREKYFLDSVDPNKFLLISDDFLRYYFFYDDRSNSSTYKFLKDDISDEKVNLNAKELFAPASNVFNAKEKAKTKVEVKTLKEFNYLTIMHLIIFFCQQILSHNEKIPLNIYQRLCDQYFKSIPDYKNKEGYLDLVGRKKLDDKKESINIAYDKNISRNTLNKSLLNSLLNILDVGLKTDYYKDFLPMISELEKKIMSSISPQEVNLELNILNLREYLIPKIEIKNPKDISLLQIYQYNYINIEDKYLSHLNKTIDYKNYDINPEDKQRVDQFNCIVNIKKNIIEKYLKMRFILHEEQLIHFINLLIDDVEDLQEKLRERANNERKLLMEQKEKEKEQKEKKLKQENDKKFKKKRDETQIEKEKKKKEYEEKLKSLPFYELKKLLENNPNNADVEKVMEKRETNALPDIENFINSITLYILPNDMEDLNLSDYICRNNFIYQYIFSKKNGIDFNIVNKLLKENLCIYLEEAKNYFELDVYKIILTPSKDKNDYIINYFYSFVMIEIIEGGPPVSITYLNNNDNPESEKSVNQANDIKKIYIMNLMFKEKDKKETLSGAKYILNENNGLLTVFCMKTNSNEINNVNINYYGKLMFHQTNSEIFNCDEIKITGTLKVEGIPNIEENSTFQEIIIGHANYDLENQEKRVKLKIAIF